MMKLKSFSPRPQRGFSLLELIVAGTLVVLLTVSTGLFTFKADRSKGQALISIMNEAAAASIRFKYDTAYFPNSLAVLTSKALASNAANVIGGVDVSQSWQGPYMQPGFLKMDSVQGTLGVLGVPDGRLTAGETALFIKEIRATHLPESIAREAMQICRGETFIQLSGTSDYSDQYRCRWQMEGSATAGLFTIGMRYDW